MLHEAFGTQEAVMSLTGVIYGSVENGEPIWKILVDSKPGKDLFGLQFKCPDCKQSPKVESPANKTEKFLRCTSCRQRTLWLLPPKASRIKAYPDVFWWKWPQTTQRLEWIGSGDQYFEARKNIKSTPIETAYLQF